MIPLIPAAASPLKIAESSACAAFSAASTTGFRSGSVARGATDPDLNPVVEAAEKAAHAEDSAIFNGLAAAGIKGIIPASPHAPHKLPADVRELPGAILAARETLRQAGVSGPYALAL